MKDKEKKLIGGAGMVAILAVLGFFLISGSGITGNSIKNSQYNSSALNKFAKCLTDQGATMYGLKTCSHCQNQKDMFGSSFQHVDYVECSVERQKCREEGIKYYPTWIIGGKKYTGTKSLETLSSLTGCELPDN